MSSTTTPYVPDRDQRTIDRLLDGLDRASSRNRTVYERQRRHNRKPYRGTISLCESESPEKVVAGDESLCEIGWVYSLSQGGIGFISTANFQLPYLAVGIHLPDGNVRWVTGMIVRKRDIPQERFIDYGVAFGAS